MMTAKTQWKLKDRVFSKAKPLQPVMIHSDKYLFEFGPAGMYLLDKVLQTAPRYWYFHAKRNENDFADWVSESFPKDATFHMNDQKGQDQTVQGWAVVFFSHLLRWFGFDELFIESFRKDKISKEIKNKIMSIMTDSGEVWTYLINSLSSAARECAMYQLPAGLPMACGGDDIMRLEYGPMVSAYLTIQAEDPTIDKRYTSSVGDFCSFMVRRGVLFKDPVILLKRFLGRISSGRAEEAVLGYYHLWAFNYNKKDLLVELLDEDELEAHSIMTRIMFNLRKEGIRTRPDWQLLRIDGEPHRYDAGDMFVSETNVSTDIFPTLPSSTFSFPTEVSGSELRGLLGGLLITD
jgi:hypothetical protein